jgi:16S rRNA (cytosine1407-C5)-methyltransferase
MNFNPRFITYFHDTFFTGKEEEFQVFLDSLNKSIPRTIRIKPGRISEVKLRLESYGFTLSPTYIDNVFSLGRNEQFDPLERRIGFTLDHLVGNFYIQELAAATSVHILTDGKVSEEPFLILDMASSPGGKTTQLSEHYPNAFIIANEPTRERIPQLLQNLDRMGSANIGVTLYPGQYFRHSHETFDKILLDAPCSGEWTLFKGTEATKHWHIKNIKNIAALQTKLFDAAIIALKVWGEMVYSTCSMNLLENEWVIASIEKKYPNTFQVSYQKRFWPHIDGTWWFFVAKITKLASIETNEKDRPHAPNTKILKMGKNEIDNILPKDIVLYMHDNKILAVRKNIHLETLREKYYFMRFWEKIGTLDSGQILLDAFSHKYISREDIETYIIRDENELDIYLRWGNLKVSHKDWPCLLRYQDNIVSLEEIQDGTVTNNFPKDWLRK